MGNHATINNSPKLCTYTPTIYGNDVGKSGDRFLFHGGRSGVEKGPGHQANKK